MNTDRTVGAKPQRVVRSSVSRNEVPNFAQERSERPSGRIIRSSVTNSRREDPMNHTPSRERVIRGPRIEGHLSQTPVTERIVRGPITQRKEYGVLTPSREIRHSDLRQYNTKNSGQMCHTDIAEKYYKTESYNINTFEIPAQNDRDSAQRRSQSRPDILQRGITPGKALDQSVGMRTPEGSVACKLGKAAKNPKAFVLDNSMSKFFLAL